MDKNKHLVWDAAENVLPKDTCPSADRPTVPDDKLSVRRRWLILVALTVLSWALVACIAIVVVAIVRHHDW
ncbi:MAG: hypothetical protein JO339_00700 [Alphaproteobacteria bacterium]|nr:hypothetical protein [Alphaproteobacteria bacterium]